MNYRWKKVYGTAFYKVVNQYAGGMFFAVMDDFGNLIFVGDIYANN